VSKKCCVVLCCVLLCCVCYITAMKYEKCVYVCVWEVINILMNKILYYNMFLKIHAIIS